MTRANKPVRARKLAQAALDIDRTGQDREHYLQREDDRKSKIASAAFGWPAIEPRWRLGRQRRSRNSLRRFQPDLVHALERHHHRGVLSYGRSSGRFAIFSISSPMGRPSFKEKRHLKSQCERISGHALGYRYTNADPGGGYAIVKEIITDPHLACILQHTQLTGDQSFISKLHFYALCAPHLQVGGWGNNGYVIEVASRKILMAQKKGVWLALGGTVHFSRASCGYVGRSDGWTDLADNFQMDWEFDHASDGNIALIGELDLQDEREFTVGLALGDTEHCAITTLFQALGVPFKEHHRRYTEQWDRSSARRTPLETVSADKGNLYHSSFSLLRAHEDKSYPGAFIASLSIPWGETKSDEDNGGYHLVWTRDMVNSASAMLAAGDTLTPLRALIYLAVAQQEDGGFSQNFWVDGGPYWRGIQLDEVAFLVFFCLAAQSAEGPAILIRTR